MNKVNFSGIIVVEGETDRRFLSSFLEGEFVITGGSAIPRETISYLSEASKTRPIIILTDPDFPGEKIRKTIAEAVPSAKHAFVDRSKAVSKGKLGVAEASKEAVIEALENVLSPAKENTSDVSFDDLVALGLTGKEDSKELRTVVVKKLHLGYGNAKTLLSRCRYSGIDKATLRRAVDECRALL